MASDAATTEEVTGDAPAAEEKVDASAPAAEPAADKDDGEWIDISEGKDGLLLKKILTPPAEGALSAKSGDKVEVHYTGTLTEDGTKFDSSRDRDDTFKFDLGKGRVIKGWDVGVATMKIGERAILRCAATPYGYGDTGSGAKIKGGASLDFDVELIGFEDQSWEEHYQKDLKGIKKKYLNDDDIASKWEHASFGAKITLSYRGMVNEKDAPFVEKEKVESLGGDDDSMENIVNQLANWTPKGGKVLYKVPFDLVGTGSVPAEVASANPSFVFYEIHVHDYEEVPSMGDMTREQKNARGQDMKTKGNERYKQGKYEIALNYYKASNDTCHDYELDKMDDGEEKDNCKALRATNYNNMAMVCLKMKDYEHVHEYGKKVLEHEGKNAKALARIGQAYYERNDFERSLEHFQKALEVSPDTKLYKSYTKRIEAILRKREKKGNRKHGKGSRLIGP